MKLVRFAVAAALAATPLFAAAPISPKYSAGMAAGKAALQSAGELAFGPEGILFVGDSQGAAIWALDTGDRDPGSGKLDIAGIDAKIAALLGVSADAILIHDLAVNPISKRGYLSVSRGKGPDAIPVIVRVDPSGKLEEVDLGSIRYSKAALPNPVPADAKDRRGAPLRGEAITDLAYLGGKLFVAGLSNEEFASNLRTIEFPFRGVDGGAAIEIYHGNHAAWETRSPVRAFIPYEIEAEPHLLAAYTCTPLVTFPVDSLKPNTKVVGRTIAELGNRNRPLDMIQYKKGGRDFILMSNSSRGVMKMSADGLAKYEPITEKVEDKAGVAYETIAELQGVEQLDKLDDRFAVILSRKAEGAPADLRTIALP
jgi:hypothetical protein